MEEVVSGSAERREKNDRLNGLSEEVVGGVAVAVVGATGLVPVSGQFPGFAMMKIAVTARAVFERGWQGVGPELSPYSSSSFLLSVGRDGKGEEEGTCIAKDFAKRYRLMAWGEKKNNKKAATNTKKFRQPVTEKTRYWREMRRRNK